MPRVSVGMPVYNAERFLDEAIMSIREQDFGDLELIICDNASTDGTEAIARRHAAADPRVSYHRAEINAGAARNYNWSFELATGEYFKWAAGDDLHAPTFLSRCVEVLDDDPDASVAFTRVVDVDEHAEVFKHWGALHGTSSDVLHERFDVVVVDPLRLREWPIFGLIRSSDLASTGLIRSYTGSDFVLLAELALRGHLVEVPEELFLHREHDGRSTRQFVNVRRRAAWFETSRAGKLSFPYWSMARDFARAPFCVEAPMSARARCLPGVAKWCVANRGLLRNEIKRGAQDGVAKLRGKL